MALKHLVRMASVLKISLVVHQFFPESEAGTEVLALSVAHELGRRGHEIQVLTGSKRYAPIPSHRYEYEGVPVECFNDDGRNTVRAWNPVAAEYCNDSLVPYFRDYLARVQPDIVHFFHLQRVSASMIAVCNQQGISTVYTPTDFWPVCPFVQLQLPDGSICLGPDQYSDNCLHHRLQMTGRGTLRTAGWLPKSLFRTAVRTLESQLPSSNLASWVDAGRRRAGFLRAELGKLDRILAPTEHLKHVLAENCFSLDRLQVMPYGIETHALTWRLRAGSNCLRVGFIGTLREHKGAHILVGALRSIPGGQNIQLKVYGDLRESSEYGEGLLQAAGGDSRILFASTFSRHELGAVLDSMDVLVVPSTWIENTPLVLHAAQASGCPVIGSDVSGIKELIEHDRNGLLFPRGNVTVLGQLLQQLASDPGLLSRLSFESRAIKGIKQYGDELLSIYSEILASRGVAA